MTQRHFLVGLLCVSVLVTSGCSGFRRPGFPYQSVDQRKLVSKLESRFDLVVDIDDHFKLEKSYSEGGFTSGELETLTSSRNRIISGRLTLINLHYNSFVADASFNRQMMDLFAELADLGVDIGTVAAGAEGAKTVLGAISAGITGTHISFNKNFFYEKTVVALVTAMNAGRKEALLPIVRGMTLRVDQYSLAQALSDLDAYYFSGTFIGALQAIQADAGEKESEADVALAEVQSRAFFEDDATAVLEAWIWPDGPATSVDQRARVVQANVDALNEWLAKSANRIGGETVRLHVFLYEKDLADMRARAIDELNVEDDSE